MARHNTPVLHPMPEVPAGEVVGYIVLCWNALPGEWVDDWNPVVFATPEDARAELAACEKAGFPGIVAGLVPHGD